VPSYVVETYLARAPHQQGALDETARAAAADLTHGSTSVRFELALHVPEDETCFYVVDAPSARHAALAAQRAGLDPIRVVEAVSFG
jgi:hypothetical protein